MKVMLCIREYETKLLLDPEFTLWRQWFLTSSNIREIFDNSPDKHGGECSEKGTLRHIWGELPPIQGFWKLICSQIDKIAGCDLPLESRGFPPGEPGARTYVSGHLQRRSWMDKSDTNCLMVTVSETFFIFQRGGRILHGETLADHVTVNGHWRALASPEWGSATNTIRNHLYPCSGLWTLTCYKRILRVILGKVDWNILSRLIKSYVVPCSLLFSEGNSEGKNNAIQDLSWQSLAVFTKKKKWQLSFWQPSSVNFKRKLYMPLYMCVCVCVCIYIYIYIYTIHMLLTEQRLL